MASRLRPRVVYSIGSQRIESLTHGRRQVYRKALKTISSYCPFKGLLIFVVERGQMSKETEGLPGVKEG